MEEAKYIFQFRKGIKCGLGPRGATLYIFKWLCAPTFQIRELVCIMEKGMHSVPKVGVISLAERYGESQGVLGWGCYGARE